MKKIPQILMVVVLIVLLAACSGSRSGFSKSCGCPSKKGLVGY